MNEKYAELYKEVALAMLPWHLARRTDGALNLEELVSKVSEVTARLYSDMGK